MDALRAHDSPHYGPSRPKRHKITVACDPCRARKVKCDGSRPVCAPCQTKFGLSANCSWDDGSAPADQRPSMQYVRQLQDRIQALEREVGSRPSDLHVRDLGRDRPASDASIMNTTANPNHQRLEDRGYSDYLRPSTDVRQGASTKALSGSSANPRITPAMIGSVTDESRSQDLYGSSSAVSFIQHVRKLVEQRTTGPSQARSATATRGQDNLPLLVPNEDAEQGFPDCALPTRKRADSLVALYWLYVDTLYPFLDKGYTQAAYESLWNGHGLIDHEQSFLCLLNIMLALSTQLTLLTAPQERAAAAAVFYARAKGLLSLENAASVRHVQIFLLFGLYLQSTNESHQCWIFVGLAVRTAQSLELHLPVTSEQVSDLRVRELLRRVWHGCVLMDRVLAMTYGRPCMIGHNEALSVPRPSPREEDRFPPGPSMPAFLSTADRPSRVDFFIYSLTLYDILHDILLSFYSPETQGSRSLDDVYKDYFEESTRPGSQFTVLEIDRKLVEWEKRVPNYLKLSNSQDTNHHDQVALLSRQAVILHQRYLQVRLLSLRPVLSAFIALDSSDGEGHPSSQAVLSRRIIFQCSVVCVKTAQEAINIVHHRRTDDVGAVGDLAAWWYNVLFLYTSATVLIAARLSPYVLSEISEAAIFESWRQAMEALDPYSIFGTSTKRLVTTLRLLFDTVPQQFSRVRQHLPENGATPQRYGSTVATSTPIHEDSGDYRRGASGFLSPSPFHGNFVEANSLIFGPDDVLGLNAAFDPNDMSWLTRVPFEM